MFAEGWKMLQRPLSLWRCQLSPWAAGTGAVPRSPGHWPDLPLVGGGGGVAQRLTQVLLTPGHKVTISQASW